MKKLLSIGFVIAFSATTICTANANISNLTTDVLSYNAASPSLTQSRQNNYFDALRLRYKNMHNRSRQHRDYNNTYFQQYRLKNLKQENHINGNLKSEMTRDGAMEQDKDRVRTVDGNRVQAVNAKQTFRKAAINYYVDGGVGYGDKKAMEMGNVDGMKNTVSRRRVTSDMFKMNIGATNLTTRDMVRNLGRRQGNVGITKRATYSQGRFHDRMASPYMSTRWMDQ
jgi:hypothetical protein